MISIKATVNPQPLGAGMWGAPPCQADPTPPSNACLILLSSYSLPAMCSHYLSAYHVLDTGLKSRDPAVNKTKSLPS